MRHLKSLSTKAKTHKIGKVGQNEWYVKSGSSGKIYTISRQGGKLVCNCKWGQYTHKGQGSGCSHTMAVESYEAQREGRRVSFHEDKRAASRQRRPKHYSGRGIWVTSRAATA